MYYQWPEAYNLRSAVSGLQDDLDHRIWDVGHELINTPWWYTQEEYEDCCKSWHDYKTKCRVGRDLCGNYLNDKTLCKHCLLFKLEELEMDLTSDIKEYFDEVDDQAAQLCSFCNSRGQQET